MNFILRLFYNFTFIQLRIYTYIHIYMHTHTHVYMHDVCTENTFSSACMFSGHFDSMETVPKIL